MDDFELSRVILRDLQRYPSAALKEYISKKIIEVLPSSENADGNEDLSILYENSFQHFKRFLTDKEVYDNVTYFKKIKSFDGHVHAAGNGYSGFYDSHTGSYSSYKIEDCINSPSLLTVALNNNLLKLIDSYFGCEAKIYGINTFWTYPKQNLSLTHNYHRDADDYKFLTVFVYWTDVEIGNGEQYIICGTHNEMVSCPLFNKLKILLTRRKLVTNSRLSFGLHDGYDLSLDDYSMLFKNRIACISPGAGDLSIVLNRGFHRGSPVKTPRLVSWIRYGLYENEAYINDKTCRVPLGSIDQRICPLVIPSLRRLSLLVA